MELIYSDRRIVVAVKPSGVLSTDTEGGMPSLLRQQLQNECIRTVHRLDAQVSGLMVFARSARAASLLSQQIRQGEFHKEYLAVVHGCPPADGTLTDLLGRDRKRRMTYVAREAGKDIRQAELSYQVLDWCEGYSLVRVELTTGRTHQIRVQFASRGWPLAGDRKYGDGDDAFPIGLWSWRLRFRHPESGEPMDFSLLPQPPEPWSRFTDALTSLRLHK